MTFAQRLQYAMDAEGLTQAALAEKSGASQAAIQKITSGKSQTTKKLLEISRSLRVRPEWLGQGEEPMRYGGKDHSASSTIPPEHEWKGVDGTEDQKGDEISLEAKFSGFNVEVGKRSNDGTTEDNEFLKITWTCCSKDQEEIGISDTAYKLTSVADQKFVKVERQNLIVKQKEMSFSVIGF
mgnify:CR=1 FL=1